MSELFSVDVHGPRSDPVGGSVSKHVQKEPDARNHKDARTTPRGREVMVRQWRFANRPEREHAFTTRNTKARREHRPSWCLCAFVVRSCSPAVRGPALRPGGLEHRFTTKNTKAQRENLPSWCLRALVATSRSRRLADRHYVPAASNTGSPPSPPRHEENTAFLVSLCLCGEIMFPGVSVTSNTGSPPSPPRHEENTGLPGVFVPWWQHRVPGGLRTGTTSRQPRTQVHHQVHQGTKRTPPPWCLCAFVVRSCSQAYR